MNKFYVYIITNRVNSALYAGMTSDLKKTILEHKTKAPPRSLIARSNSYKLVYYEEYEDFEMARQREKQLKRARRFSKNALINKSNPTWHDLSFGWYGDKNILLGIKIKRLM
ncbi:MAG: GIY-YIG nuclease family protein [Bacteroidetes bacterium]|nr:GIY-YIG nuclease family protein [Bacteroidota bacterium]